MHLHVIGTYLLCLEADHYALPLISYHQPNKILVPLSQIFGLDMDPEIWFQLVQAPSPSWRPHISPRKLFHYCSVLQRGLYHIIFHSSHMSHVSCTSFSISRQHLLVTAWFLTNELIIMTHSSITFTAGQCERVFCFFIIFY